MATPHIRQPVPSPGTLRIQPSSGWAPLDLRELWASRELLFFLVWRDLKVRYKQTLFGGAWAVIQPFMLMVVFTLFLGRIPGIAPSGIPYPVFAFAGLVVWTLFAQGLIGSSSSLVDASNLLQKVYFPRLLLPIAAVGSYVVDFVVAMAVLAVLMAWFGVTLTWTALWVVPIGALAVASAVAVGIWLSAVNVRYRDVRHALPFIVQLWLVASPVAYAGSVVPVEWQPLYNLNPMAGVIEGFRWALLGQGDPPIGAVVTSGAVVALLLIAGLAYFRRVERTFADVI